MAAEYASTTALAGRPAGWPRGGASNPRSWRGNDGSSVDVPYLPGTAPGDWRPTPPTYQDAWGPDWGQVATFGVTKPISDFQPPPPPALNSPAYAAALSQVESLGALNSKTRTAKETQTAGIFWAYDSLVDRDASAPLPANRLPRSQLRKQHNTMTRRTPGCSAWSTSRWVTPASPPGTRNTPTTAGDRSRRSSSPTPTAIPRPRQTSPGSRSALLARAGSRTSRPPSPVAFSGQR